MPTIKLASFSLLASMDSVLSNRPLAALVLLVLGMALVGRCILRGHAARDLRSLWAGMGLLMIAAVVWAWSLAAPAPMAADAEPSAASGGKAMVLSASAIAVRQVVKRRCSACHSSHTTLMRSAPWRLNFDDPGAIDRLAPSIYRQVVVLENMPVGNITRMTAAERATIARWYRQQHPGTAK